MVYFRRKYVNHLNVLLTSVVSDCLVDDVMLKKQVNLHRILWRHISVTRIKVDRPHQNVFNIIFVMKVIIIIQM